MNRFAWNRRNESAPGQDMNARSRDDFARWHRERRDDDNGRQVDQQLNRIALTNGFDVATVICVDDLAGESVRRGILFSELSLKIV
jgi:hypothetical protein